MRLSRRQVVQAAGAVGLGLLAACGRSPGQGSAPTPLPRVGVFSAHSQSSRSLEAFREGLGELGHFEGQNIALEYRFGDGRDESLRDLAAELVRLKMDVLVAAGPPAIGAAKQATDTIPIVMVGALDPVAAGFVRSLAQPGGNITGVSTIGRQLTEKRLELLKEAVPTVARVAALDAPPYTGERAQLRVAEAAASMLGVDLQLLDLGGPEGFERSFEALAAGQADALLVLNSPTTVAYARPIGELALTKKLPAIFDRREFVEAGGLMSYGPSITGQWRRAAYYVDRILKGTKPADLPVEQPREFEFVINLRTAQALGLTIPQHVLLQATEVIQ
jgi:putative tryptophan/tyrosine transport system substrate-binding protein